VWSLADLLAPRELFSPIVAGRALVTEHDDRVSHLEQEMLAPPTDGEVELLQSMLARCRTALA
jgi:hypothetical protein